MPCGRFGSGTVAVGPTAGTGACPQARAVLSRRKGKAAGAATLPTKHLIGHGSGVLWTGADARAESAFCATAICAAVQAPALPSVPVYQSGYSRWVTGLSEAQE